MNKLKYKRIYSLVITILLLAMAVFQTPVSAAANAPLPPHLAIGYWQCGSMGSNMTLALVDSNWDVINVSYLETQANGYTPQLNLNLQAVYRGTPAQQKAAFIADIQWKQAQGKKVVLSCGGQNTVIHLDTAMQRDIFLQGLKDIMDEYGFDGFDLNLEGGSVASMSNDIIGQIKTPLSINLAYILRDLKNTFGPDFIISAAPEYCYMQSGAIASGSYGALLAFVDSIRDILTYIHPQYFGGYDGDFRWLEESAQAGSPFAKIHSIEGYVRLSEMLITGFVTKGKGTFIGLRPDQVAFGVSVGHSTSDDAIYGAALNELFTKYPYFRGISGWTINADELRLNRFINTIAPIIAAANNVNPPTNAQVPIISRQPADQLVSQNSSAYLSVQASVYRGSLSYQWYLADEQTNMNGTPITGATGTSFFPPTDELGTKYYFCIVTNTDFSAAIYPIAIAKTEPAAVTVTDAPDFGLPTWQAEIAYTNGSMVVYQGQIYRARWWTQGDVPGSSDWGPWELLNL